MKHGARDVGSFYIVNPHASNGRARRIWNRLMGKVRHAGRAAAFELTRCTMHAASIASRALEAGYDPIVAVGGDGTVNEVLNGFYRDGMLIRPGARLAYLPCGTGADLARTMGYAGAVHESLLEGLRRGRVVSLDHGWARFRSEDGGAGGRYFMNEASTGFSAAAVAIVNRSSKVLGGKMTFMTGALRALLRLRNPVLTIEVDGRAWYEGPAFLASVSNGQYFGGSMRIAPEARMDDNLFDVVLIQAMTRREVVRHIGKVYQGAHVLLPQVRMTRGRSVRIRSAEPVPLEMDGEHTGSLDAFFEVVDRGIRFLLPEGNAWRPERPNG